MYKITYEDGTSLKSRSLPEILKDAIEKFTWTKEHIGYGPLEARHARIEEILTIFDDALQKNDKIEVYFGLITAGSAGILYGADGYRVWLREWTE